MTLEEDGFIVEDSNDPAVGGAATQEETREVTSSKLVATDAISTVNPATA